MRKHINKEHEVSAAGGYEQIHAQSWLGGRRAIYWRVDICPVKDMEIPPCVWGLFGKGFGDKTPQAWKQECVEKSIVR